jgi:hypothetical protein
MGVRGRRFGRYEVNGETYVPEGERVMMGVLFFSFLFFSFLA